MKQCTALIMWDAVGREVIRMYRQKIRENFLHFPLNFAVNQKVA